MKQSSVTASSQFDEMDDIPLEYQILDCGEVTVPYQSDACSSHHVPELNIEVSMQQVKSDKLLCTIFNDSNTI